MFYTAPQSLIEASDLMTSDGFDCSIGVFTVVLSRTYHYTRSPLLSALILINELYFLSMSSCVVEAGRTEFIANCNAL